MVSRRRCCVGLVVLVASIAGQSSAVGAPLQVTHDISSAGVKHPRAIGVAGNGTLWVAGDDGSDANYRPRLLRVNPSTGAVLSGWPVTIGAAVYGSFDLLADGDDVWVTEDWNNTLTRGTVSGNALVAGYPKSSGGSGPTGLGLSATGDLWVANASNVTRFDPSTNAQRVGYPKPNGASSPARDLTIGKDGDVFLAIYEGGFEGQGKVARLDGVTGDPEPGWPKSVAGGSPERIATGIDGDIWTLNFRNVSRLDPATGAPRPGFPKDLTQGHGTLDVAPNGDVWVTDGASQAFRLDGQTGSVMSGYPLYLRDAVSSIEGVAFAANGDPWIAAASGHLVHLVLNPPKRTLTVTRAGNGSGSVTGPGVTCPADCSQSYEHGADVTLKATPAASSTFSGWSGACSGKGGCEVTMSAARTVTATFAKKPAPPGTKIKKLEVEGRGATVKFKAVGGKSPVKFQCKLDGAKKFKGCKPPLKLSDLKVGKHTIRVRARDANGLVDPTPAKKTFSVG